MNLFLKYLYALRLWEVTGKIGFVLVGGLFAIKQFDVPTIVIFLKIAVYCLISGLAIFSFNAWAGYNTDKVNKRLDALFIFSKRQLGFIAAILFTISVTIIMFHKQSIILTALGVLFLWFIYSMPKGLKGIPFGGILVSFITEILLFHLSYLFFSDYSFKSIFISIYFAVLVAAGHILHEMIDYEADMSTNFLTTVVYFKKQYQYAFMPVLYVISLIWLCVLKLNDFVSIRCFVIFLVVNILVLFFSLNLKKQANYHKFRKTYLVLFSFALLAFTFSNNFHLD